MQPSIFKRYVQVGRVGLVNYGPDEGKLCTIVDIIDQTRVLVDGPANLTGVRRQSLPLTRLSLTDIVVKIPHGVRQKTLSKTWTTEDVLGKWNKTSWAKKRAARAAKANLGDFDRFKVMVAKRKVRFIVFC